MIPGFLKNTLINAALKRVAKAGDGGSTILGALVTLLLAETSIRTLRSRSSFEP